MSDFLPPPAPQPTEEHLQKVIEIMQAALQKGRTVLTSSGIPEAEAETLVNNLTYSIILNGKP